MRLKRLPALILFLFIAHASFSQSNIAGTWTGIFFDEVGNLGQPKLVVEIYDLKDSGFTGITHLYYRGNKYEHYKMAGRYFKNEATLVFMEISTIAVDLGIYGNCLGAYVMKLRKDGDYLIMEGIWTANKRGCTYDSKVYLQKEITQPDIVQPAPVKKPDIVKKPPVKDPPVTPTTPTKPPREKIPVTPTPVPPVPKTLPVVKQPPLIMPTVISKRETDIQSLLEIAYAEKDSIRVDVYDNGEIDGDSVSVYEENIVRINNKMISTKPLTFYVSLNKNTRPISHLRLVAENLGSIPPCTALMVVTTKTKRYEVRLSSSLSKNATVEFFLKE